MPRPSNCWVATPNRGHTIQKTETNPKAFHGTRYWHWGIFFKAQDPQRLAAWYRQHLGLPSEEEHNTFELR
jgi:hypothetical protein